PFFQASSRRPETTTGSRRSTAARSRRSRKESMADLSTDCAGIKSPNPFWLASAPPANSGEQVMRAFEYGWGGAVWKTLGRDPPVINTTSRYGAIDIRSEEHTSELQSHLNLVCRLLLEKKKNKSIDEVK